MNTLKRFVAGAFLCLMLTVTVLAGDMPGPGLAQTPSPNPTSAGTLPRSSGRVGQATTEIYVADRHTEGTSNPITDAIIFAIQLLALVW